MLITLRPDGIGGGDSSQRKIALRDGCLDRDSCSARAIDLPVAWGPGHADRTSLIELGRHDREYFSARLELPYAR